MGYIIVTHSFSKGFYIIVHLLHILIFNITDVFFTVSELVLIAAVTG